MPRTQTRKKHKVSEKESPLINSSRKKKVIKRRIYNEKTGTFYLIRPRSLNKPRKGSLLGKWKPPVEGKEK